MVRENFNLKIKRSHIFATVLLIGLSLSASAFAGECKVKDPTENMIADAVIIGGVLEVQMTKLANEYRTKTGKELKVAFVARAGQNMEDVLPLRDVDSDDGHIISLQEITRFADQEVPKNGFQLDRVKLEKALKKKYGDANRKSIYSHFGLIFWNHPEGKDEETGQQTWWFSHMLRPCPDPEDVKSGKVVAGVPELYDEDIFRFFADDPYELRAQILVPSPAIQDALETMVLPKSVKINGELHWDNRFPKKFKGEFYNAAASWLNTAEANSNQFVLEMLAAASQPKGRVTTRAEAQDVLAKTGYRPMRAYLKGQQAMAAIPGASKFAPFVRFHYEEQPAYIDYGIAEIITTLSIEEYMRRNNWIVLEQQIFVQDRFGQKTKKNPTAAGSEIVR